jgi:Ca2+-binding EF-hand superfamily protein
MDVVDTEGDDKMNIDEYARWERALMNRPESESRRVYSRIDTDGDGYITRQELLESIRDFYFDEGPDSFGAFVLGLDP